MILEEHNPSYKGFYIKLSTTKHPNNRHPADKGMYTHTHPKRAGASLASRTLCSSQRTPQHQPRTHNPTNRQAALETDIASCDHSHATRNGSARCCSRPTERSAALLDVAEQAVKCRPARRDVQLVLSPTAMRPDGKDYPTAAGTQLGRKAWPQAMPRTISRRPCAIVSRWSAGSRAAILASSALNAG